MSLPERIASRLVEEGACLVWTGARDRYGYGRTRWEGRHRVVHRIVWEQAHGAIPEGLQLDHLCRNTSCSRLAHLEVVTPKENSVRRSAVKTHCVQGHAFDEDNTYVDPKGHRSCRICYRAAFTRWYNAKKGVSV